MTEKTRGGRRPGAGRKPGKTASSTEQYHAARADKERALARLRQAEADERERRLIPVAEVEQVVSTAFSTIAQALLGLPDTLERTAGLTASQCEKAEQVIHGQMEALADQLATLSETPPPDHAAVLAWLQRRLS